MLRNQGAQEPRSGDIRAAADRLLHNPRTDQVPDTSTPARRAGKHRPAPTRPLRLKEQTPDSPLPGKAGLERARRRAIARMIGGVVRTHSQHADAVCRTRISSCWRRSSVGLSDSEFSQWPVSQGLRPTQVVVRAFSLPAAISRDATGFRSLCSRATRQRAHDKGPHLLIWPRSGFRRTQFLSTPCHAITNACP